MISVSEEAIGTLSSQAEVCMIFRYDRIFEIVVEEPGFNGFKLVEKHLPDWRTKDYDAVADDMPSAWARRFDVSKWGFLVARDDGNRVGGAVIAYDTIAVNMIDRAEQAVLWDLRVAPDYRSRGVGLMLFQAVEDWARQKGCSELKIETQNNNVAACKFYARRGCTLGGINRFAYPASFDEVQMLWYKKLA
ncbi:MAG: GNAT family N-acetyltransferase [Cyanobacteria bacterium REEB67]|nr:GNAT family N-acetyltransferase [Cyanobacteria bacterium REEB67]